MADKKSTVALCLPRAITVEDLLTFRCGHGLILAPPGRYPIQKAIADLGIFGPPDRALPLEGDAWMQRLSGLPLLAHPGEDRPRFLCARQDRGHRSCCCNRQLALGGLRFFSTSASVIIIIIGSTGHS